MNQDSAKLDLSLSQRAYLHEAVPAEDGANRYRDKIVAKYPKTVKPSKAHSRFICLHPRCGASFPAVTLLEAHYAIIHAKGKQTPNAVDNFPIAAGHWYGHTRGIYHGSGYSLPTIHRAPTDSLPANLYNAPTEFYDPHPGWLNPFNATDISDHGHIDPVGNMPASALNAVGGGTFTQGFGHSGIASHSTDAYGHTQPTIAAPPLTHAVAQASNIANATGQVQPGVVCPKCDTRVGRQSDLGRHMKMHEPDAQVFQCQVQGCQYSSKRKDKLMEHSRRPH